MSLACVGLGIVALGWTVCVAAGLSCLALHCFPLALSLPPAVPLGSDVAATSQEKELPTGLGEHRKPGLTAGP